MFGDALPEHHDVRLQHAATRRAVRHGEELGVSREAPALEAGAVLQHPVCNEPLRRIPNTLCIGRSNRGAERHQVHIYFHFCRFILTCVLYSGNIQWKNVIMGGCSGTSNQSALFRCGLVWAGASRRVREFKPVPRPARCGGRGERRLPRGAGASARLLSASPSGRIWAQSRSSWPTPGVCSRTPGWGSEHHWLGPNLPRHVGVSPRLQKKKYLLQPPMRKSSVFLANFIPENPKNAQSWRFWLGLRADPHCSPRVVGWSNTNPTGRCLDGLQTSRPPPGAILKLRPGPPTVGWQRPCGAAAPSAAKQRRTGGGGASTSGQPWPRVQHRPPSSTTKHFVAWLHSRAWPLCVHVFLFQ